ncbi:hypothetical protein DFP78_101301 [Photobacterium lutimaris]|nr:hypothetical protein DFP78_101301 [Photobacterium lutimaris]
MHMSCFLSKLKQLFVFSFVAASGIGLWLMMMFYIFKLAV